jgi:hypothetical protein
VKEWNRKNDMKIKISNKKQLYLTIMMSVKAVRKIQRISLTCAL